MRRRGRTWGLMLALCACAPVSACSLTTDFGGYSTGAMVTPGDDGGPDGPGHQPADDSAAPTGSAPTGADADAPDAAHEICRPGRSGPSCEMPCPDGKAGEACDFRLVLALPIPRLAKWNVPGDVPYSIDRTSSTGAFSRIAYRLVLDAEEVWVELDAFTNDPKRLGVPVDWVFDQPVTNVMVHSFSANQPHVLVPSAGNIELWSHCYNEGPDGLFDAHDVIGSAPDCYGSMQVHVGDKPVLCVNHWSEGGTKNLDIGIGPSPGKHPDWTFAENAGTYQKRTLEVYVR